MIRRIIVRSFPGILFFFSFQGFGAYEKELRQADSLFKEEKYTEAIEVYERFLTEGLASNAMLLKMAYVADASGDYADALLFLDLYYKKSGDRLVIGKIEELAEAHDLYGYTYSDLDYLGAIFSRYKTHVSILAILILLSLLVYMQRKAHRNEVSYPLLFLQLVLGMTLLFTVNFRPKKQAIVVAEQSLLRSGPSAGAEPISIISKGHKVTVSDHNAVWSKIIWEGEEVYIRKDKLKVI